MVAVNWLLLSTKMVPLKANWKNLKPTMKQC